MAADPARGWAEVLRDPMRTIHTVRHLQPAQVTNRATRWIHPLGAFGAPDLSVALLPRAASVPAPGADTPFDGRSFSFLNRRIVWEGARRWFPESADALWIYNLHYFRFVWSTPRASASALIADWIEANEDRATVAWDAYPTSLRVREWIEWLLANPHVEPGLRASMTQSLAAQVEQLRRRLEFHLMGNHLLENAITLCWAGLSFSGRAADEWRGEGAALLRRQLEQQVLQDGTHEERTPMYQALLAEGLLRLSEVASRSRHDDGASIYEDAARAGERLLGSLDRMVHPDGDYALLNDTALGVAPTRAALARRFDAPVAAVAGEVWALPDAGYAGCSSQSAYLVFDGGPIGPDHQPGHGHADALSFELSHRGRRLITDTGAYTYTWGAAREYDRGTAAHNTLAVDGRNQAELWGAFRCARRTTSHWAQAEAEGHHAVFSAGYRGPGRDRHHVWHTRRIVMGARGLSFVDDVRAAGSRSATLRLHFAPGVNVRPARNGWRLEEPSGRALAFVVGRGIEWEASSSPYHPEFGREEERASLVARFPFDDHALVSWRVVLV